MKRATDSKTAAERWALPAKQARSQATRTRILRAAERCFAEAGYDGAHISAIAKKAGCSVGAVYFRFKDKDALFFAIAESFATEIRASLPDMLAAGRSGRTDAIIGQFVERAAASFRTYRGLFRAIVERGLDNPPVMAVILTIREEMADTLHQALSPTFGTRDAIFMVQMMTQIVYGFLLTGVLNPRAPTRIDDNRTLDELKAILLAYIRQERRTT
jgi:AcrR family transcriptional regulator